MLCRVWFVGRVSCGEGWCGWLGAHRFLTPLYILNGWFEFEATPSEIFRPPPGSSVIPVLEIQTECDRQLYMKITRCNSQMLGKWLLERELPKYQVLEQSPL